MRQMKIKLQRRAHMTAINIPKDMLPYIGDDVEYIDIRQYSDGKITIKPIHSGVVEKC